MARIYSIQRAFFFTLNERAGMISIARATGLPTFKTQTQSASPRNYKAGVSFGDFLAANLVRSLIPTLRSFGKVFTATRECAHDGVHALRIQFSR